MKNMSVFPIIFLSLFAAFAVWAEDGSIKFKDKLELGSTDDDIYSVFTKDKPLKIYNPMQGQIFIDEIGNGQINAGENFYKNDNNLMVAGTMYSFFLHDRRIYKIEVIKEANIDSSNENLDDVNIATVERIRELFGKSGRLKIDKEECVVSYETDKLKIDYQYSAFSSKLVVIDVVRDYVSGVERAKFNSSTNKKKAGF